MADEPTGNLDTKSGEEVLRVFQKLNEQGITIIFVTHDPEIAEYSRRTIHIRDGLIERDEPSNGNGFRRKGGK
jgi:putative ABC transport system ATP-binding protein